MDEKKEKKVFSEIKAEVTEARHNLEDVIQRSRITVDEAKEYLNEQYEDMDVNELSENVQNVNNLIDISKTIVDEARNLRYVELNPYFARVDFVPEGQSEPQELRIGVGGYWSEKDNTQKIIDWRAPISALYYDYETGKASYKVEVKEGAYAHTNEITGTITDRAQIVVKDGEMSFMASTDQRISDELLLKALSENAPEKMRPVIQTIQAEQNDIIRDTDSEVLVVDGRAGSGKTVIAMHRLAWLLYNQKKVLNTGNVMVLSPNTIFSDYISGIMPELMENPVPEKEWDDLMNELVMLDLESETRAEQAEVIKAEKKDVDRINAIRFKNSIPFFEAMNAYIDEVLIGAMQFTDFKYEKTVMPKEKLEKFFFKNFSALPPYERFYNMAYFIMDDYLTLSGRNFSETRQARIQQQISQLLIDRFAEKNLVAIYKDFLSVVDKVFPGASEILTEDDKIRYEDMQVLFYLQVRLYGVKTYKGIRHLMVDEMQDYTVFQLAIIKEIFGGKMTFLGDRLQTILPDEETNILDYIIEVFPERTLKVLNKTYRSTAEITDFCNKIIGEEDEAEGYRRHGKKPEVHQAKSEQELVEKINNELRIIKEKGFDSVAILCENEEEAYALFRLLDPEQVRFLTEGNAQYRGGVAVMSAFLAKGMEFDAVIVVTKDNTKKIAEDINRRSAFFIACTRALHRLLVLEKRW